MSDELVKVTILLPVETVKKLDDIARIDLRGSRGRAIEAMVRDRWLWIESAKGYEKK